MDNSSGHNLHMNSVVSRYYSSIQASRMRRQLIEGSRLPGLSASLTRNEAVTAYSTLIIPRGSLTIDKGQGCKQQAEACRNLHIEVSRVGGFSFATRLGVRNMIEEWARKPVAL